MAQGVVFKQRYKSVNIKSTPTLNRKNLVYIATRKGAIHNPECGFGLWGRLPDMAESSNINSLQNAKKTITEVSKTHTVYRAILSVDDDTAKRHGLYRRETWQSLADRKIPVLATEMGIDCKDFCWCASMHYVKGHPHVHIMYWDNSSKVRQEFIPPERFELIAEKVRAEFGREIYQEELRERQVEKRGVVSQVRMELQSLCREARGVNNVILSYAAEEKGYRDPRWMTCKQATDRGWQVRKGEKPERVEFWHYYDTQSKRVLDTEEVQHIRAQDPDCMRRLRLAAYTYCVFNAGQVEGVEPLQPARCADVEQLARSRDVFLANLGVEFREGGGRACYRPGTDSIVMPYPACFTSDYAYVCTLLHEAGHATGHFSRLDRPMGGGFGTPEYAKEELRAEIASAFTGQALGLTMKNGRHPPVRCP